MIRTSHWNVLQFTKVTDLSRFNYELIYFTKFTNQKQCADFLGSADTEIFASNSTQWLKRGKYKLTKKNCSSLEKMLQAQNSSCPII